MSRPIKFRFWMAVYEKYEVWENLCELGDDVVGSYITTNVPLIVKEQFTGLLDKNGKEIYEGDIVKLHLGCEQMDITEYKIVCQIGYGKMGYGSEIGFTGYSKQGQHFPLPYGGAIEVIGNIHENADLLK